MKKREMRRGKPNRKEKVRAEPMTAMTRRTKESNEEEMGPRVAVCRRSLARETEREQIRFGPGRAAVR